MENSLNSSSPESSVSDKRPIFKKPTNLQQAFEVSLEESVTAVDSNKSDQCLDASPPGKVLPFKKTRKSIQHSFSITSDDSLANSETEESITFKRPLPAFPKQNKTLMDFFNVSFNETNASRQNALGKSFDDSNTVYNKSNPFKKRNESQNDILIGDESSVTDSANENRELCAAALEESPKQTAADLDEDDNDESSTCLTKQNPFRMSKKQSNHSETHLELSEMGDDKSVESEPEAVRAGDESSSLLTKQNPFRMSEQQKTDSTTQLQLSVLDESVENEADPEIQEGNESQVAVSSTANDKSNVSLRKAQKRSTSYTDFNEPDSTTYNTKQNPFKKSSRGDSLTEMHLSVTNESNSLGNGTTELQNNSREDTDLSVVKTKLNPFREKSLQSCSSAISVTGERSKENSVLTIPEERSEDVSVDRNTIKSTSNMVSYLEQSSINDENLNGWMSDESVDELPPPRISSLRANLSQTKEKPAISSPTNTLSVWEQKLNEIVSNVESRRQALTLKTKSNTPQKAKPFRKPDKNVEKPADTHKPPKLIKPAPFATKKLYNYVMKKLKPKYGIDTVIESENLVSSISEVVKKVTRKKTHQKKLIESLKKEMAEAGLIETTMDFYEFVIKFLPYSFRVKVVPCLQPVTNIVYPPKDVMNPFDKIL